MTVSAGNPRDVWTANGVQTSFTYTFEIPSSGDIDVYVGTTLMTLGADYTVTDVGEDGGGTVDFSVAPANLAKVVLVRSMTVNRTVDYTTGGGFYATNVNQDFDRYVMIAQQVMEAQSRSIRIAPSNAYQGENLEINATPSERLGKIIGFTTGGAIHLFDAILGSPQAIAGKSNYIPRVSTDETQYELRSPAQTRADIGADNASNLILGTIDPARVTGTYNGISELAAVTFSGTITSTLGTITASTPTIFASQTWNSGAVAFKVIDVDVTATAGSLSNSRLIDLKIGGASKFYVDGFGSTIIGGSLFMGSDLNILTSTAIPAGGTHNLGLTIGSNVITGDFFGIFYGSGAPATTQAQGSLYLRTDGTPYYNTSGSTTWEQLATLTTAQNFNNKTVTTPSYGATGTEMINADWVRVNMAAAGAGTVAVVGIDPGNTGLSASAPITTTGDIELTSATPSFGDNSTKLATTEYVDRLWETGDYKWTARTTATAGWLMCDGSAVSRTTYADLFAVIGTTYGSGDGSTTFNVPNVKGRLMAGRDNMGGSAAGLITAIGQAGVNGTVLGATGGSQDHILTTTEMPVHNHPVSDPGHMHGAIGRGLVGNNLVNGTNRAVGTGDGINSGFFQDVQVTVSAAVTGISTQNRGGSGAHNNLPPLIIANCMIRT